MEELYYINVTNIMTIHLEDLLTFKIGLFGFLAHIFSDIWEAMSLKKWHIS